MIVGVFATQLLQGLHRRKPVTNLSNRKIGYSMIKFFPRAMVFIAFASSSLYSQAQAYAGVGTVTINEPRPYKIQTSGKQVTVKSTKNIRNIMVWTASGHRVIEQRDINNPSFTFNIPVSEKWFFVMIHVEGSKPYTEKIGVQ
jgi:cytochrome c oxidase assembly protein Cox11